MSMSDKEKEFITYTPARIQMEQAAADTVRQTYFKRLFLLPLFVMLLFLGGLAYLKGLAAPPDDFPVAVPIVVESGAGVRDITDQLQRDRIIKSSGLLYYTLKFFYDTTKLKASTYVFEEPISTFAVADRLIKGEFGNDLVKITLIEGQRARAVADKAAEILPAFNKPRFIVEAEKHEGKLYPDTYKVPKTFTDVELLDLMRQTFEEKVARPYRSEIAKHKLNLDEIVILASILEREANSEESMKMVSGILQNRLAIGMPLQADASLEYVLDKELAALTAEDLKEVDSPYNTYLYPGLPPTAIGNPGQTAILAVLRPTESDYLYYLTDREGNFHYAKTYAEHLKNINRYLR